MADVTTVAERSLCPEKMGGRTKRGRRLTCETHRNPRLCSHHFNEKKIIISYTSGEPVYFVRNNRRMLGRPDRHRPAKPRMSRLLQVQYQILLIQYHHQCLIILEFVNFCLQNLIDFYKTFRLLENIQIPRSFLTHSSFIRSFIIFPEKN